MNIKMNEHLDTINSIAWGAVSSLSYTIVTFDTGELFFETFMVVSKASIVGFFGGLFGYFAKALGEIALTWIKKRL